MMRRQRDWEAELLINAIWILLASGPFLLLLVDAPLLELLAPIGAVVLLWWVAAELIGRLFGRVPGGGTSGKPCPPELLPEHEASRRRLRLFLSLRDEADGALNDLRRSGWADAAVAEVVEALTGLRDALQRAATRERLILASMAAAVWMDRTAPLLDLPDRLCRADAAYWVDQIAREHPHGVRILAELDADPRIQELPLAGRLRGTLEEQVAALGRAQVEVETRAAHRLLEQMDAGDWWIGCELRRRRLKRRVREHRHRHSA